LVSDGADDHHAGRPSVALSLALTGHDEEEVVAQRPRSSAHGPPLPPPRPTETQGDDRGHADDDAQHRQQRAQLVGYEAGEGETDVLTQVHKFPRIDWQPASSTKEAGYQPALHV
jgi:hypothetical protein